MVLGARRGLQPRVLFVARSADDISGLHRQDMKKRDRVATAGGNVDSEQRDVVRNREDKFCHVILVLV
jgi:hypothetical protein